jgi:Cys-Gly metallodipeptidase DUG1
VKRRCKFLTAFSEL